MVTNPMPGITDFTRDVPGRYICNGLDEAQRSADRTTVRPDGRPQIEAADPVWKLLGHSGGDVSSRGTTIQKIHR